MTTKLLKRKASLRLKRKKRIRAKISGVAARPRVSVYKSNKYLYAQAIDDVAGNTLAAVDGAKLGLRSNRVDAVKVGEAFAATLKEKNIDNVVFDVNGFQYTGVIAAFADALRNNGIKL